MMLVTFSCKAYADITMFGDVAVSLLKMMGHSGTVPGALSAEDIPAALERLRSALATEAEKRVAQDSDDDEPPVTLSQRAVPLIALLEAAQGANTHVMWDK
jgi:hypothetical protein